MSEYTEQRWKKALTSILEELTSQQYKKTLFFLDKIPQGLRAVRAKEEMAQRIIECYGVKESISEIKKIMADIPRNDDKIQDLLKKRKKQQEKNKGKKRKYETDSKSKDLQQEAATGFKKNNIVSDSDSSAADQSKKCKSDMERNAQPWRKTIHDLKISGAVDGKAITGKVVEKSGLRTYQRRDKTTRFFFYLGVADETASIKVMVYGKERYQKLQQGSNWLFRDVIMDENVMKVTKMSKIAKTSPVVVSEELELEARMIIYPQRPVCPIKEAKMSEDKTMLSVEGTITQIGSVERINVKNRRRKMEKRDLRVEDDTGFIRISLWGNNRMQLRGISNGDFVRVTNVKTNNYYDTVSLNSTDFTRISKVQKAPEQNVRIEIIGVTKADRMQTELEAEISGNVHTLVVDSSLLANVFEVKLHGDLEEKLLDKMPFSANAEIKGSKINKIVAV